MYLPGFDVLPIICIIVQPSSEELPTHSVISISDVLTSSAVSISTSVSMLPSPSNNSKSVALHGKQIRNYCYELQHLLMCKILLWQYIVVPVLIVAMIGLVGITVAVLAIKIFKRQKEEKKIPLSQPSAR